MQGIFKINLSKKYQCIQQVEVIYTLNLFMIEDSLMNLLISLEHPSIHSNSRHRKEAP